MAYHDGKLIKIKTATAEALEKLRVGDESYDSIISRNLPRTEMNENERTNKNS